MSKFGRWSCASLGKAKSQEEYDNIIATVPKTTTPKSLADFGYHYTPEGKLRQIKTGEPFAWLGQKHYDALGDAIVEDLYKMLETKYGMQRVMVPLDAKPGEPQVPIFVTPNWKSCGEDLMCIIQGSGAVRPGMWARALCINDSLVNGTIFSYVEAALARNMGIVVFNPNENTAPTAATAAQRQKADLAGMDDVEKFWLATDDKTWKAEALRRKKSDEPVAHNERPQHHANYVWSYFVTPSNAKRVNIVAHSYGGKCTTSILQNHLEEMEKRVPSIVFTDAINDMCLEDVYGALHGRMPKVSPAVQRMQNLLKERTCNWVASDAKLGTPEKSWTGCKEVSAGHNTHEYTSQSCFPEAVVFIDDALKRWKAAHPEQQEEGEQAQAVASKKTDEGQDEEAA